MRRESMTTPNKTPKRRSVTITDVASAAGVSKSTVSLVLQSSPLIAPETAERVRKSVAALGYVYNRRAADLRRESSNMIRILLNHLGNPFFPGKLVRVEGQIAHAQFLSTMAHNQEQLVDHV